jgi:N-hydroxyarylamine O-acetyltransferase
MLRAIGFTVRPLAARVIGGSVDRPRTHMLLLVEVGARPFLADVGFGVHNLTSPLPFEPGVERTVHGETFRLKEIGWNGKVLGAPPAFELEVRSGDGEWKPLYRVSLEEQHPADFAMANWYCATHPDSAFVRRKLVSLPEVGTRHILLDRELEVRRNGASEKKVIEGEDAYRAVLRDVFRIELGPDALLRW